MQLSRFAAGSVKVVLSGQGADEPHGGYGRHQAAAVLGGISKLPGLAATPLQKLAGALPRNERAKRAARLVGPMADAERLVRLVEITGDDTRSDLTGTRGDRAEAERAEMAADVLSDVPDRGFLERALYLDTHLFLPDGLLVYGDKMSMAHGLEQRVPFLDVELMQFVERIPGRVRLRGLSRKHLHKKALGTIVPDEVLNRPKRGFSTPYDSWLRDELGAEVERRITGRDELSALVDAGTVSRLVRQHRSGRADHKRLLYCLLELTEWNDLFGAGAAAAEPVLAR
jgi:asparagine synthase (glutamine-hydrolysing)